MSKNLKENLGAFMIKKANERPAKQEASKVLFFNSNKKNKQDKTDEKPKTDEEIKKAALDNKSVIIVPVAFVSEHSETLVELDIEYKKLAKELGISSYLRVPALNSDIDFIKALANLCLRTAGMDYSNKGNSSDYICPADFCQCINQKNY